MEKQLEEQTVSQCLRNARLLTLAPVKGSKGLRRQYLIGEDMKTGEKKQIYLGMVP